MIRKLALTFAALTIAALSGGRPTLRASASTPPRATESFLSVASVHAFSNGRVLVLDNRGHRVALLDSTLSTALLVDAVGAGSGALSSPVVALTGLADTAFIVDLSSRIVSMINADGLLIASIRNADLRCTLNMMGSAIQIVSPRLLYCADIKTPTTTTDGFSLSDSAVLVAWDIAHGSSRRIASVQTGVLRIRGEAMTRNCRLYRFMVPMFSPFPVVDFWHVLSDASVLRIDGKSLRMSLLDSARGTWKDLGMLPKATVRASSNARTSALERFSASLDSARRSAVAQHGTRPDSAACTPPPGVIYSGLPGVVVEDAWQFASLTQVPPVQTIAPDDFSVEHSELRAYETVVDRDGRFWAPLTASMSANERTYVVVTRSGQEIGTCTLRNGRRIVGFDQANHALVTVPSADGRFTL